MRDNLLTQWFIGVIFFLNITCFIASNVSANDQPTFPAEIDTGQLLYETSFKSPEDIDGWRMEGPGKTEFRDDGMHMWSPGDEMHHVFWCPKRFPGSFAAQWKVKNHNTDAGLLIVFFAAAGKHDGKGVFHKDLPERDGTFKQYTQGALRNYHISYYANAVHNPDRDQTNLRKNPGFHLVQEGPEGIPTTSTDEHIITLVKKKQHIFLWVDDRPVISYSDGGEKGGKPHGDGYIGLRQMKWSHFAYRNFRVWELNENSSLPDVSTSHLTDVDEDEAAEREEKPRITPPVFDIPRLENITIDGDEADWNENGFHIDLLHRFEEEKMLQPDPGADVALGWDENGLLVRARINDDRWVEADKNLWKYDSLELYTAPFRGSPQRYQVVFSPGMSASHAELRYNIHDNRALKPEPITIDAARKKIDDRTVLIETRLPWKHIDLTPESGSRFSFQVIIDDNDEPGSEFEQTERRVWFRNVATHKNSRLMHTLRLSETGDPGSRAAVELDVTYGKPPTAVVTATPDMAGTEVSARINGNKINSTTLNIANDSSVSKGLIPLKETQSDRVHFTVDDQRIGTVRLYGAIPQDILETIRAAGNATSEQKRYRLLKKVADRNDLPALLREDLDVILPIVDWWANGRKKNFERKNRAAENGYLTHFFYPQAGPDNEWPGYISPNSPLYPMKAFYRARALVWIPIQIGSMLRNPETRTSYYDPARKLLRIAEDAYPNNPIIKMYNGESIPWESNIEHDPNAPEWANLQREGMEKLTELIHWWIDHRQIDTGEFGGGWGDDVEMWRWWTPILVGFKDPKITAAQKKLSRSILNQPHMKEGYTSRMSDVEHTAEDSSDAITPMIFLEPEENEWRERALRIVELARNKWMGKNERGQLQFKSTYFNVHDVDLDPLRAVDTVYHPRVFQPALLHWQRSGDETVKDVIQPWMNTWVDATHRSENGKPSGITPSAIHWPDGEVGGGVNPWWKPQNYTGDLYHWPSAMSLMLRTMLLTYHMTGDEKYLSPIRSMAKIRMKYVEHSPEEPPDPGSAAWCALETNDGRRSMTRFLPLVLAKYRLLTGDDQFDDLLKHNAGGYIRMRIGEGRAALVEDLRENVQAFRINKPGYTTEMRWTDRVLKFNERWGNVANDWDWPEPNPRILFKSATGNGGGPAYFPMNGVRWGIPANDFAALVTENNSEKFEAEIYNFQDDPRDVPAQLLMLDEGKYTLTMTDTETDEVLDSESVRVKGTSTKVTVTIPSDTLCRLQVR